MKIRQRKGRAVGFSLLALAALALGGCCTCRERYSPALKAWAQNLERLRPTVVKGAKDLPDDLRKTKVGLLDDTIRGIKRVDGAGPEVWSGGAR